MKHISELLLNIKQDTHERQQKIEKSAHLTHFSEKKEDYTVIRRFRGKCAIKKKTPLDCVPVEDFIQDPVLFISRNTTLSHQRTLDFLIGCNFQYSMVYPTRKTIGNVVGIGERQVSRILNDLKKWGLIITEQRHKLSSHYYISSFLFKKSIMQSLGHYIKSFRKLSLSLLMPFLSFSSDVTQLSKKKNMNIFNLLSYYICKRDKNEDRSSNGKRSKKESNMNAYKRAVVPNDPIGDTIRGLTKKYRLTRRDQVRLAAFPDEAIKEADEAFDRAKQVNDSYGFLVGMCFKYCNREQIKPDWDYVNAILEAYNINIQQPHQPVKKSDLITHEENKISLVNTFKPDYLKNNDAQPQYENRRHSANAPYRQEKRSFIKKEEIKEVAKKPVVEWQGHTRPVVKQLPEEEKYKVIFDKIIKGNKMVLNIVECYPLEVKNLLKEVISKHPEYDTPEVKKALSV